MILVTVVTVIGGAWLGARWLAEWVSSVGGPQAPDVPAGVALSVEIHEGASAGEIADMLVGLGVVSSGGTFSAAVSAAGAAGRLRAGTYDLETGMDPETLVQLLLAGPIVETFWITIPEGLRVDELLDQLAQQAGFSREDLEQALLSGSVTSPLRPRRTGPGLTSWEGLLFPDTYQLGRGSTAAEALGVLASEMNERYRAIDWSHPLASALSIYDRLIVASIVEAETRLDSDRPLVAAVIYNRLAAGMPLQMDATVLYALDIRGRAPTVSELALESPYNTYVIDGLPPTPIAALGSASLAAVAAPAEGDWLYFVLTGVDGSHSFTADYEEFLRWKEESRSQGLS